MYEQIQMHMSNTIIERMCCVILLSFVSAVAAGQSTNPLNYSGRMYIESMEVISTPRYVSYEEHAILSSQAKYPVTEVVRVDLDFENNTIRIGDETSRIKVTATKKYNTNYGWVVVIYANLLNSGDKAEIVWREYGNPFIQQITPDKGGVSIARMNLSYKPVAHSEEDALLDLLRSLGSY